MTRKTLLRKSGEANQCFSWREHFPEVSRHQVVYFMNTHTFAAMDFGRRLEASDEHIPSGSVRSEQRRLRPKDMPPSGLRPIWPVALLLARSSIAADTLPPSRLATGQIGCNERVRIHEIDH
ncbi:MAG: hypothetical protein DME18_01910 [Verrucomicrobia bacterium]|nr:MAG: hypothetical protein DME18_01910 [Verrucomicrobiota bacterium]